MNIHCLFQSSGRSHVLKVHSSRHLCLQFFGLCVANTHWWGDDWRRYSLRNHGVVHWTFLALHSNWGSEQGISRSNVGPKSYLRKNAALWRLKIWRRRQGQTERLILLHHKMTIFWRNTTLFFVPLFNEIRQTIFYFLLPFRGAQCHCVVAFKWLPSVILTTPMCWRLRRTLHMPVANAACFI